MAHLARSSPPATTPATILAMTPAMIHATTPAPSIGTPYLTPRAFCQVLGANINNNNNNSEWVHDRYDEDSKPASTPLSLFLASNRGTADHRRAPAPRHRRESPTRRFVPCSLQQAVFAADIRAHSGSSGAKLKVENIHYDLAESDLDVRSIPRPCLCPPRHRR